MTRREYARRVLAEVFRELPADASEAQARKAISAAYPFGVRAMHPYKVWLDESRKWLEARFPELRQKNQQARLKKEIEKRGGAVVQMPRGLFEEEH